eukprot:scaffold49550_cov18-Tisochrysis_lutea.AAC.1
MDIDGPAEDVGGDRVQGGEAQGEQPMAEVQDHQQQQQGPQHAGQCCSFWCGVSSGRLPTAGRMILYQSFSYRALGSTGRHAFGLSWMCMLSNNCSSICILGTPHKPPVKAFWIMHLTMGDGSYRVITCSCKSDLDHACAQGQARALGRVTVVNKGRAGQHGTLQSGPLANCRRSRSWSAS